MILKSMICGYALMIAASSLVPTNDGTLESDTYASLSLDELDFQVAACPGYRKSLIKDPTNACARAAVGPGGAACVQSVDPTTLKRNCCTSISSQSACVGQTQYQELNGSGNHADKLSNPNCPAATYTNIVCDCGWLGWGNRCSDGATTTPNCPVAPYSILQPC